MLGNEEFANYLGVDYERKGNLIYINCPYHADSHPSMVIYPTHDRACHCYPCGQTVSWEYLAMEIKGISYPEALKDLGNDTLEPSEVKRTIKAPSPTTFCEEPQERLVNAFTERMKGCSDDYPPNLLDWLNKKHLLDTARKLRWKWHPEGVFKHWSKGLVIPYIFYGKCVYARFRGLQTDDANIARFAKPKGPMDVGIQPYFTTFRPNDTVFIVEGESDAASVWSHGMSAIGIPGASARKAINTAVAFIAGRPYIKRIVACGDNDQAGQKMNQLIRAAMVEFGVQAEFVTYEVESEGEKADLNDDHVAGLFKPPVQWGMNYAGNYDRNFPDNDFGNFVTEIDQFLLQCEAMEIDPWEQVGNVQGLLDGWQTAFK